MPGTIARGRQAIIAAQEETKGGGNFSPYLKKIFWNEDKEEHYLLFLNDVDGEDGIPIFQMIQFIEDENGHFQETVSKTDGFFGDRTDSFIEDWDATAVKRNIAVAVELEPISEVVKGYRKPKGFEVKTEEYTRKILDDDGEPTDEEETVITPVIGYISQSPNNFFNHIENYDANEAPITETAVKITRLGKDKHTSYALQGYDDQSIDLSNLLGYLDGVSYLKKDLDEVLEIIDGKEDIESAHLIGQALLNKIIDELLDEDRYDKLLAGTNKSMDKFNNKKKESKEARKPRATKASQRSRTKTTKESSDSENGKAEASTRMKELRERAKRKESE